MPPGLTSPVHLLVIGIVALVVLGPERLPSALGRVGAAVREFKRVSDAISRGLPDMLSLDAATAQEPHPLPPPDANGPVPAQAVASPQQMGGAEEWAGAMTHSRSDSNLSPYPGVAGWGAEAG